jgi:hypothetical protein
MSWVATNRTPIEKAKDLEDLKPPEGLTSLSKAERKQFDAAKKAAAALLDKDPANVNISGDADSGLVQVAVAPVQEV